MACSEDSQRSAGGQLSLGIVFQEITGALTRAFGEKGVLISDVPEGGPAHAAGIQSGDVLLAVGDLDVSTPVEATRAAGAAEAGTTMTLHLLRGRRARSVEVSPIPAYDMAALAVADVAQASAGLEARGLTSAQILERAGIPATARVLRLNGRPAASRAQAARELRGRQPVTVLLRLDGRQFFAVIEPAP